MIEVAGFDTSRLRAEPIGRGHREGLIALLGDVLYRLSISSAR